MLIFTGTTEFELDGEYAVTIGKFDGIHKGHRELIDRMLCKSSELKSAVFSFDKSPGEFFSGKELPALTTKVEKRIIFDFLGIDALVEYPFNDEVAATDPEAFIRDILVGKMHAKYIVAGKDASFGDKGKGDAELIARLSEKYGYEYEIVDKLNIDGEEVSSTLIRNYVSSGNMEKASKLIGVPYAIRGIVTTGNRIGRTIGFPTINIEISKSKLMPPFGVYFTEIKIDGKHYNGITNIGTKPTITDDHTVFAETNILDFNEDVYGREATVKLLHFRRPEMKFDGLESLKNQIADDIRAGKEYFA